MDKLLEEYLDLMRQLQEEEGELYEKFVEFFRRAQKEFEKQYGALPPGLLGWIDPLTGRPPVMDPSGKLPSPGKPPGRKP